MDLRKSIANQTDVSLSLAKHVISTHAKDENLVFSPLSLHVLLGMIASGCNDPTRDQLLGFLRSNSIEELNSLSSQIATVVLADGEPLGGPRLSFANSVWVDRSVGLKDSFKQIVENDYLASSTQVDFQNKVDEVIKEVNAWADRETNGLIKEILPPHSLDASTKLILANAVYFKGVWRESFQAIFTKDHDFFPLNGSSVKAPFMTSWYDQYIRVFNGFKVLGLPYKQERDNKRSFSMYIFLPDAKDGLPSLIDKICSEPEFMEHHLPYEMVRVKDFRIPKFKIGFGFEASKVLKAQGVVGPFTLGGLSEMVDDPGVGELLCVSRILHKSFIEVNEQGTEAAAVSLADMLCGCANPIYLPPRVDFVADHPFLFIIRENFTGAVLFIGQLLNPLVDA